MDVSRLLRSKYVKYCLLALLVLAAAAFYNYKKKNFLQSGLPHLVEDKTKQLYKVSYDDIQVDEIEGNLTVRNLVITGDTIRQNELIKANDTAAQKSLFQIHIPEARLTGFRTSKALLSKKIICDKIIITNPSAVVFMYPLHRKQDIRKQGVEVYKQLLGKFELIQANQVEIKNGSIEAIDVPTKSKLLTASNTSINLIDVRVDSAANKDTSRSFFSKQLSLSSASITLSNKGKTVNISDVAYNTNSNLLSIAKAEHNALNADGGYKVALYQSTITDLQVNGPVEEILLSANKISVGKTDLQLKKKKQQPASAGQSKQAAGAPILPSNLKRLAVKFLVAKDVSFKQLADGKENSFEIDHTSITINKVNLTGSSTLNDPIEKLFGEVNINNPNVVIKSKNADYQFAFSQLRFSTAKKAITLKDFSVVPLLSEDAFAKKAKVTKDRYNVKLNDVVCSQVNFNELLKGQIKIGKIETRDSYFKVFLDNRYPPSTINKVGKYPNQLLFAAKVPVNIGELALKNIYIEYKEKSPLTDSSGIVTFKNSNVIVTNVTNRPKGKNDVSNWTFSSSLLGSVRVNAKMKVYLYEQEKGRFDIEGSMESTEAKVFNQVARPISLMNIDKGTVNKASFKLSGDNYKVQGNLYLNYENFRITLLKKKENDKIKKRDLLSFIANLVVKSDNKKKAGNDQHPILFKRDVTKSFFHTLWHSLFKGIREALVIVI
jgi:hypothetical protein